jgi:hypothetical protein
MTLRVIEGFDHFDTASLGEKWGKLGAPTVVATQGRRGTAALYTANNGNYIRKTIDSQQKWYVGHAIKFTGAVYYGVTFLQFLDAGTVQIGIGINALGYLVAYRGATPIATSVNFINLEVWNYIEVYVLISNTAGTGRVVVRVNNDSTGWIDFTGDTCSNTNEYANVINIGCIDTNLNHYTDDLYICDGAGSVNNNFLGDCRVDTILPSGAGSTTQFTPSAGSNYACVDENPPNEDTDYVESSTLNHVDTYAFADIAHTPTGIFGVQINMDVKKDDAGDRWIASITKSGSSGNVAGTAKTLSTGQTIHSQVVELDPDTAALWTKAGINAAEFGIKVAV